MKISVLVSVFNGMAYLERFLRALGQQTVFRETEFVFIHNAPRSQERRLIEAFRQDAACAVKYLEVPRESLYASWNRGILASSSDIVAIWNIDDIRTPDSLERQAAVLENNPGVALTYGDYIQVDRHGAETGTLKQLPEYDRALFLKKCKTGPFVAWRKSISEKIGLFDEQFRSAGDFDYWIRVASTFDLAKTPGPAVGYFLNEGAGISTDASGLAMAERNVVNLRYGNFGEIKFRHLGKTRAYRHDMLYFNGRWQLIDGLVADYRRSIAASKRRHKIFSAAWPIVGGLLSRKPAHNP